MPLTSVYRSNHSITNDSIANSTEHHIMIVLLIALNSISIPCLMSVYRSNHSITNDSITNITNDSITNDSISITNDSITNSTEHRIMIVLLIALNSISIPCLLSVSHSNPKP